MAAHITAASPGGPRYDASLPPDKRKHYSNGIWLCQNCAHLVDSDPAHYTVELLDKWKREAAAASFRALVVFGPDSRATASLNEQLGLSPGDLDSALTALLAPLIPAAKADLALFKRMPGRPAQPIVLNLTMADGDEVRPFNVTALAEAMDTFNEIQMIGPPGTGKTITLLQLVEAILGRGRSLAVFIPFNEWRIGVESVFDFIRRRHGFGGVPEADLKLLAQQGRLILAMDGWNEVDPDSRARARTELAALRRDFPEVGLVISTRPQALDLPVSGPAIQIDRLTEAQQLEIARAARGRDAETIVEQAWRTPGIDELVTIPLYLAALLTQAPAGTFPTTKEEILRLFVAEQDRGKDGGEALRRMLRGCHNQMLTALAVDAVQAGNTSIPESRARQVVKQSMEHLSAQGQIATALEPMTVLDVLVDHHLLVRSTDGRDVSFQHQQFQEWYASREVEALMRATAANEAVARKRLRAVLDSLAWEEPVLFASERASRADAGGVEAVATALLDALWIDPMLAAEMIFRSAESVWEKVKDRILDFVERWHVTSRVDRAVKFMITTGRPEFVPRLWPLISHADDQVQLRALRAGRRFRASALGPNLQDRITGLAEPVRQHIVPEMVHNGGIHEIELAAKIAASDPSDHVKVSAIEALLLHQADRMAAQVLRTASDTVWRELASRGYSEEVGDPDSASRLRLERQKYFESEIKPLSKLRLLLNLGRGGAAVASDIASVIEANDFLLDDRDAGWVIQEAHGLYPAETTAALLRRLQVGREVPYGTYSLLQAAGIMVDEGPIVDLLLKRDGADRLAEAAVGIVGPQTVGTLIDSVLDLHAKLMEECRAAGPDDPLRAEYWRLIGLLSKTRLASFVEALLSRSPTTEATVIALLAELVARHGDGEIAGPLKLEPDLRVRMIAAIQHWAVTLLADPKATRSQLADVAQAIGRASAPELVPVLYRMLTEDLTRWKGQRAEFLAAHAAGHHGPSEAQRSWTLQYRRAFAAIGDNQVIDLMKASLRDAGFAGFGVDAAWVLKDIYDLQNPQTQEHLRWGANFSQVKAKRAEREPRRGHQDSSPFAEAILDVVRDLIKPGSGTDDYQHAFALANVALRMPYGDRSDIIEKLLALPVSLRNKQTLLTVLVQAGEIIRAGIVLDGIKNLLEEAKTEKWLPDDNTGILAGWLQLLPFSDQPARTLNALELLDQNLRQPWRLESLLSALGYAPSSEADLVLEQLCRNDPRFLAQHDWLFALEKRGAVAAGRIVLGLLTDPSFAAVAGKLDGWTLSRKLALAMQAHPDFRADVYDRFQRVPAGEPKAVLEAAIAEAADEEAVSLLLQDYAAHGRPFNGALSSAIRKVAVGTRPAEGGYASYVVSTPLPNLRKKLFAMTEGDTPEAKLAAACLSAIDELRDDYGPTDEPRHPDVDSGRPWPPLAAGPYLAAASAGADPPGISAELEPRAQP